MTQLYSVIIGLVLCNFGCQYLYGVFDFMEPDYLVALERTYFQIIALVWLYLILKMEGKIND